jgi:small-conductance mechanosensitive channel
MGLSLVFCVAVVAGLLILRFISARRRVARFVCMSIFFAIQTALILALIGSPLHPVFRPQDLPRQFWLQILTCFWWGFAAREMISFLGLLTALRRTATENKLLFDIIAASIYVCSALAMMGFVFGLPLQGLLATSGSIAIVLGLALQSTLGDVFSRISLGIERPYGPGDEILLEGGVEGEVVQVNWRSTHLRNGANDVVVIPNSAIAKMRIQNISTTRTIPGHETGKSAPNRIATIEAALTANRVCFVTETERFLQSGTHCSAKRVRPSVDPVRASNGTGKALFKEQRQ